jgi:hypothetical protein
MMINNSTKIKKLRANSHLSDRESLNTKMTKNICRWLKTWTKIWRRKPGVWDKNHPLLIVELIKTTHMEGIIVGLLFHQEQDQRTKYPFSNGNEAYMFYFLSHWHDFYQTGLYIYIYTSKIICKSTPSTQNKVIKN